MGARKRATIEFDVEVHDELVRRAKDAGSSLSDEVNAILRDRLLADDDEEYDLAELERRRQEPGIPLDEYVADLQRRGKL